MFGKRDSTTVLPDKPAGAPAPSAAAKAVSAPATPAVKAPPPQDGRFDEIKVAVFH